MNLMSTTRMLAKHVIGATKTGTPIRHARAVVVSSTLGTSVVTLDGGATQITAFNYGHSQSLTAGTVVDVLIVGRKAYVIGAYNQASPNLVTSVFGRTGAVSAQSGDYNSAQITAGFTSLSGFTKIAAGSSVVTTNSSATAAVSYGVTFSANPLVVAMAGDNNQAGLTIQLIQTGVLTTSFQFQALKQNASSQYVGATSLTVRVNWIAIGT